MLTYIQRCGARLYDDFLEFRPGAAKELEDCLNDPGRRLTNETLDGMAMQSTQQGTESPDTSSRSAKAGHFALTEIASTLPHSDRTYKTQNPASPKPATQPYGTSGSLTGRTDSHVVAHSSDLKSQGRKYQSSAVIDIDPESRWVLTCANSSARQTGLTQVNVCRTASDKDYFQTLKRACLSSRSWTSRIFSLTTVKSIRFLQVDTFSLHRLLMHQILTCH